MVKIRTMELDDLEEVMVIEKENFALPWTENGFFSFLLRQDTLFLVAEEEGKIAGYCGVVLVPEEGDITNVSVAKARQGRGIGGQLIRELVSRAGEAGAVKLYLEVRKSNAEAIRLYERNGFAQIGVRRDYYEEPKEDAILMARG